MTEVRGERPRPNFLDVRLYIPSLILLLLGAWGYIDLRSRLDESAGSGSPTMRAAGENAVGDATFSGLTVPTSGPAPRATDAPACTGSLTPEVIREVVGQSGSIVFECHGQHASGRAGELVLEVRVSESGRVDSATSRGDLATSSALMGCIYADVETWTFPPPTGGCATVEIPFYLAAGGGSATPARAR